MQNDQFRASCIIARDLRRRGHACCPDFSAGSLKSRLRLANKLKADHVLIIGDEELARRRYSIKRLDDSRQWEVSTPELIAYLDSRPRTAHF